MKLRREVVLLLNRMLVESGKKGPYIELPLYLMDNGDYLNMNNPRDKSIMYESVDIVNNFEIFELLDYLKKKGIIREVKAILGYKGESADYEMLERSEFRRKNTSKTTYDKFTVLIGVSKYDILEYIEKVEDLEIFRSGVRLNAAVF